MTRTSGEVDCIGVFSLSLSLSLSLALTHSVNFVMQVTQVWEAKGRLEHLIDWQGYNSCGKIYINAIASSFWQHTTVAWASVASLGEREVPGREWRVNAKHGLSSERKERTRKAFLSHPAGVTMRNHILTCLSLSPDARIVLNLYSYSLFLTIFLFFLFNVFIAISHWHFLHSQRKEEEKEGKNGTEKETQLMPIYSLVTCHVCIAICSFLQLMYLHWTHFPAAIRLREKNERLSLCSTIALLSILLSLSLSLHLYIACSVWVKVAFALHLRSKEKGNFSLSLLTRPSEMERKKRKETSNKKHAFATQAKTSEGEKEERGKRKEDGGRGKSKLEREKEFFLAIGSETQEQSDHRVNGSHNIQTTWLGWIEYKLQPYSEC